MLFSLFCPPDHTVVAALPAKAVTVGVRFPHHSSSLLASSLREHESEDCLYSGSDSFNQSEDQKLKRAQEGSTSFECSDTDAKSVRLL